MSVNDILARATLRFINTYLAKIKEHNFTKAFGL